MKTILLGLAAVVVLFIAAVIVAPSFIDWTRYRDSVAGEIEQALGRSVTIDGAVEAALVPTPRLSLRGVRLGNLPGASSPDMAQAEALEIRVALWPLLSGQVVVESVVLRKPVVTLEILEDGRRNWQFTPEGGFADAQFDNVAFSDGIVTYRDGRTGREERVEGVNGRLAAGSVQGPLRASAELRYGAIPLRFTLSTGRFDLRGQSPTPFNLMAELPAPARGLGLGLERTPKVLAGGSLNGSLRFTDRGMQVGGQFKVQGDDFSSALAALGNDKTPAILAQRFAADGTLNYREGTIDVKGLGLQLGDTRAQGSLIAITTEDKPRVDLDLTVGRIDLDAWMAAAAKAAKRPAGDNAGSTNQTADEFAIPDGVELTLNAAGDALTYRGGAVRQMKLVAELADGAAEIHRFSAQLPGATDAAFNGKLTAVDGRPRLDGVADLAADDFRSLLAWLGEDISDLPAGRLNKVSALAQFGLSGDALEIADLDARFDATKVSGALTVALRDRPAIGANLIVDKIDLDSYLGSRIPPVTLLTTFDANLVLRAEQLTVRQATARDLSLDGTLVNGELTMRKFAFGDLAGARGSLSGTLAGFDGKPRMKLDYDVIAKRPDGLLALAGITLPFASSALEPFSASGKLAGGNGRYTVDTTMAAGDTAVALNGELSAGADGGGRSAFDVTLAHPDYVEFLRLLDSGFVPQRAAKSSAINLAAHVEGAGAEYSLSSVRGNFGPLALDGRAALAFEGSLPRLNANLTLGDVDTGNFLSPPQRPTGPAAEAGRWSGEPIDLDLAAILGGRFTIDAKSLRHGRWSIAEPKIEMTLGDGGMELTKLSGRLMGGQLEAQGRLVPSGRSDAAMALDYSVKLTGADPGSSLFGGTPIDISGGRFDVTAEGAAVGTSEAALLAGMTGKGSVILRNGAIKGFDLQRLNDGFGALQSVNDLAPLSRSALASGSTRLTGLRGNFNINDGVIGMDDLRIDAPAGKATVLLAADLLRWRVDATAEIALAAQPAAPPLELQLSGRLDAPERDVRTSELQNFLRASLGARGPRRPVQQRPAPQPSPAPQVSTPSSEGPMPEPVPPPATPPQTQPPTPAPRMVLPQSPSVAAPSSAVPQDATAPRVLSVSPNAPAALTVPESGGAVPSASQAPAPLGRVLRVSPNASPSAVPPQPAPGPQPRVLSVSPNAGAPGDTPTADATDPQNRSTPTQLPPQPAEPSSQPQPASPGEIDNFTRDVLRGLEQQR